MTADVEAELRFHFSERVEELVSAGATRADAETRATEEFGDVATVRTGLIAIDRRVARRRRRRETVLLAAQDVRLAYRRLRGTPGFLLATVSTLALGIGAVCAVFGTLDAVALRPLPYPGADRLVRIQSDVPAIEDRWGLAKGQYLEYRRNAGTFDAIALYRLGSWTLRAMHGGEARLVRTADVNADLADVLSVRVERGRFFRPAESLPDAPAVAVVSDAFWRTSLGADQGVLGSTIEMDGSVFEVVGVLAPDVRLPEEIQYGADFAIEIWLPLPFDPSEAARNNHLYRGIGRLGAGVSAEAASAELAGLTARFPESLPTAYTDRFMSETGFTPVVTPLRDEIVGGAATLLWIVLGAVAIVLLITCANVANLFLVRAEARRREIAVRAVLGASRGDLARHRLAETLLVTGAAGAAGLCLAAAAMRVLVRAAPANIPRLDEIGLTPAAIAFAGALSLLIGVVFGTLPSGRRGAEGRVLTEAGRASTLSRGRRIVRQTLVAVQIGLCFAILAGAGLLLRSFAELTRVEPGFSPDGVVTFRVPLPADAYPDARSTAAFHRDFAERLARLPRVTAVGAGSSVPLGGLDGCTGVRAVTPEAPDAERRCVSIAWVTPGYFEAVGIPLTGVAPSWADLDAGRVVLVPSRGLARTFWSDPAPLDAQLRVVDGSATAGSVIAVAHDISNDALDRPPVDVLYAPILPPLVGVVARQLAVVVRSTAEDPLTLVPAIRRTLTELDPRVPLVRPRTLTDIVADSTARLAFTASLLALAAIMALVIGAVGIYGVISYSTLQRSTEIGIRMALGAPGSDVRRLIVADTLRVALLGIAGGLFLTLAAGRSLAALLYGVSPADPFTLAVVAAILVGTAALAGWLPARRALRNDPLRALRG